MVFISDTTQDLDTLESIAPVLSSTDSFVEQALSSLTKAFPELSQQERTIISKILGSIVSDGTKQEEIKNIIQQLTLSLDPQDKAILINTLKKLKQEAKLGFQHTNTVLFTKNIIGQSEDNLVNSSTEDKKTNRDNISSISEEKSSTVEEKSSTLKEENSTLKEENSTVEKKKTREEEKIDLLLAIKTNIDATSRAIDFSKIKIQYSEKALNNKPETQKALAVFKQALGYNNKAGAKSAENQKISQKAVQYLNYNIALGKKVRQATKNSSIIISEQERQQSQDFILFLQKSDIDARDFYRSLGTERNFDAKFDEKLLSSEPISDKKADSLASNLSENTEINTDNLQIDNVFKDIDTTLLIKSFPLPKNMKNSDFFYNPSSPENFSERIQTLVEGNDSYPFLEKSTKDRKTLFVAKKRLALYLILKNNPTMNPIPENVLKTLYPSKSTTGTDKLKNFRMKIMKIPRENLMKQYEQELIIPLMKNNFLNPKIEQDFSTMIKKGYLSYVSTLLTQTPELDQLRYNAKDITITNNLVQLPLYSQGQDKVESYLTIENGKVFITNSLYNPSDTNNIQQLKKGKVRVGQVKDFSEFAQESIKTLPQSIALSSGEVDPQSAYQNNFRNTIDKVSTDQNDNKQSLQTNIGHSLSQNKVRTSVKDMMYGRNNDGSLSLQDTIPTSPFYQELHDYDEGEEKKITKANNPDTFSIGNFVRTSMLRNSSQENIRLKNSFSKLQKVLSNKSFNDNLSFYLKNNSEDKESPKRAMLSVLDPNQRKQNNPQSKEALANFLYLFSTHHAAGMAGQNNRIRVASFEQTVDKLASGVDFDILSIENTISSGNPIVEKINEKYNSPDILLEEQLDKAFE